MQSNANFRISASWLSLLQLSSQLRIDMRTISLLLDFALPSPQALLLRVGSARPFQQLGLLPQLRFQLLAALPRPFQSLVLIDGRLEMARSSTKLLLLLFDRSRRRSKRSESSRSKGMAKKWRREQPKTSRLSLFGCFLHGFGWFWGAGGLSSHF